MKKSVIQDEASLLRELLRRDFNGFLHRSFRALLPNDPFLPNWHIEAMAYQLERCRLGAVKRLIITLPPRSGKSIIASVVFPAWILGHDPTRRIIAASYANDLASKLGRDCRELMKERFYKDLFPGTRLDPRKSAETDFATTTHGNRFATSVGGTLTGLGGSFFIIDDPIKPEEAASRTVRDRTNGWFGNTAYSRLNNKADDVIIIVTQRTHIDDLVGHVLERKEEWVHLNLPAIAEKNERIALGNDRYHHRKVGELLHPAREPQHILDAIKDNLGSAIFSAQYQQEPVPAGGNIVQRGWFKTYDEIPQLTPDVQVYQSWDTAQKAGERNDYSVCLTFFVKKKKFYLVDVFRARLDYPSLKRAMVIQHEEWRPHRTIVEDKGSGTSLCQEMPREHLIYPIPFMPEGDKEMRLITQSSKIEAGQVLVPSFKTDWLEDFIDEVISFPGGRHDDQVDALTQLLQHVSIQERHVLRSVPLKDLIGFHH
jgi:predicted phage terminase large subunit-like protein